MRISSLYLLAVLLGLSACSTTQTEKAVDSEVAKQPVRSMHGEVAAKGYDAILKSPQLTEEQKNKFLALHKSMIASTFKIQTEMSKLKGVLFETLTTTPYDAKKAEVLKKRIVKLNNEKMDSMFLAFEEVKRILGYMSPQERRELMRGLMEFHSDKWN